MKSHHALPSTISALRRFTFLAALVVAPTAHAANAGLVGAHFEVRLSDLPAPYQSLTQSDAAPDAEHVPLEHIERTQGVLPQVPPGFEVGVFAEGLSGPREMAVAPGGIVFVTQMLKGEIIALRDADGDGVAETETVFSSGFREPSGIAYANGALYVADRRAVWRVDFDPATLKANPRIMVTRPGALGKGGGHITRELLFEPNGSHFFVSIGSETNVGEDPAPRATIQLFRADGQMQASVATGLRNPVGLAFYPGTDDLYTVVDEREGLGAGLVPDYLTRVKPGAFYGFPYAYLGSHPDPQFGDLRPDLVKVTETPDMLFMPRSGPFGLFFCKGEGFPPDYQGDALVALHGSWQEDGNPPAHGIVRVRFHDGRPEPGYEMFMAGFEEKSRPKPGSPSRIWGRPVWLAQAGDGALLVSDDVSDVIWRVRWTGKGADVASVGASAGASMPALELPELMMTPTGLYEGPAAAFAEPSTAQFPGMVEPSGIEPLTSSLRTRRSPN